MPDGENRENKSPPGKRSLRDFFDRPPVEPRITEPDPNYVSGSAPKPLTSEEVQEAMFRNAAKKLAREEQEIVGLAGEYFSADVKPDLPNGFHIGGKSSEWFYINSKIENLAGVNRKNEREGVSFDRSPHSNDKDVRGLPHVTIKELGVNSDIKLKIPVHMDMPTLQQYQSRLDELRGYDDWTDLYFDDEGNYAKVCVLPGPIEVDESRKLLPEWGSGQVSSEMTPDDFELAGSVLDGIKSKLMAALGKTPPEPQSSGQ